jgi:hypothetical protein
MLRSQYPVHGLDARVGGNPGASRFFNDRGDLNASGYHDALSQINRIMQGVETGSIRLDKDESIEEAGLKKKLNDQLLAAFKDHSEQGKNAWAEIGSTIGLDVTETAERQGIARRHLARADLTQSNTPRIRVRTRDVRAYSTTGAGAIQREYVRDRYLYPPEYNVVANVRVLDEELYTGAADLLDEVFLRAQEAVAVKEDIDYMTAIRNLTGVVNPMVLLVGGLSPSNLATMHVTVNSWNLTPATLTIGSGIWSDILGNATGFANVFDPVTRYELYREAKLGRILGLDIITDGFKAPAQRVLTPVEVLLTAVPTELGGFSDRGPVRAVPVDSYGQGELGRGWLMSERISQSIANLRGYCYGKRV